jgi:hypothetical protein
MPQALLLPDELWIKIFIHIIYLEPTALARLPLVSKQFHR